MKKHFYRLRAALAPAILALCSIAALPAHAANKCYSDAFGKQAVPCVDAATLASSIPPHATGDLSSVAPIVIRAETLSLDNLQDSSGTAASHQVWHAERGASLRDTLDAWAAQAGWQAPTWSLPPEKDFTLGASYAPAGTYKEAVNALFEAFPPESNLRVHLYTGNHLTIVEQTP